MKVIKWVMFILLLFYVVFRAVNLGITNDEAYSFFLVKTRYYRAMPGTANTHWLNTLGMQTGMLLFGDDPWSLRIFSVLAFLLYGYSAMKLSTLMANKAIGFALYITLLFNPYVLDFFSLARGYGMVSAFALCSIWRTSILIKRKEWSTRAWSIPFLLAVLSVLSNFTALYLLFAVTATYLLALLVQKNWNAVKPLTWSFWTIIVMGTALFATASLLFIKYYSGDLESGGHGDFIGSIFGSLISSSLYGKFSLTITSLLTFLIFFFITTSAAVSLFFFLVKKQVTSQRFTGAVIAIVLLLNILFHLMLNNPYLLGRTTILLYPLFVVFFWETIGAIHLKKATAFSQHLLSFACTAGILWVFAKGANGKYCYEWKPQAESRETLALAEPGSNILIHQRHAGVWRNYYSILAPQEKRFRDQLVFEKDLTILPDSLVKQFHNSRMALLLPPFNLKEMKKKGIRFYVVKSFPISGSTVLKLY